MFRSREGRACRIPSISSNGVMASPCDSALLTDVDRKRAWSALLRHRRRGRPGLPALTLGAKIQGWDDAADGVWITCIRGFEARPGACMAGAIFYHVNVDQLRCMM